MSMFVSLNKQPRDNVQVTNTQYDSTGLRISAEQA